MRPRPAAQRPAVAPPPDPPALPESIVARRAALLACMLRRELARRWPEKYTALSAAELALESVEREESTTLPRNSDAPAGTNRRGAKELPEPRHSPGS
jgi:hypothetical protein